MIINKENKFKSRKINYNLAKYIFSACSIKDLPNDLGIEIAFLGRSNSGKSSIINKLTKNKLAYVSKKPGRTKLINIFEVEKNKKLVDLPGYGYAKVGKKTKKKIDELIEIYLNKRQCIKGIFLIIDIRRGMKEIDKLIMKYSLKNRINLHIILNKVDKLNVSEKINAKNIILNYIEKKRLEKKITFQMFSAKKNIGIEKLKIKLNSWYKN